MLRYQTSRRVYPDQWDDSPEYRSYIERSLKTELGEAIVEQIPLEQPTMVRIRRDEIEPLRFPGAPLHLIDREICYECELTPCRTMDVTLQRLDPSELLRVPPKLPAPKTPWQKFTDFLNAIAPEVKYDGGYGTP